MPVPDEGLLFASAHHGTIHRSHDDGLTWQTKDQGIAHPHVYTLGSVRIDGALKLYAGTEPPHFYESDDVGESWHVRRI
jgi:hypothetical protein